MKVLSYSELASLFPTELLVGRPFAGESQSLELLYLAALTTNRIEGFDLGEFLPYAGDFPRLSDSGIAGINSALQLNGYALSAFTSAIQRNDLTIPAKPDYGIRRVSDEMAEMLLSIAYLRDITCVRARHNIFQQRCDEALDCAEALLNLSSMLCRGGGDPDLYFAGVVALQRAVSVVNELIATIHPKHSDLSRISSVLGKCATDLPSAFVRSQLSDLVRDVIITLATAGGVAAMADLEKWLNGPLVRKLYRVSCGERESNSGEVEAFESRAKLIITTMGANAVPLDILQTLRELSAIISVYNSGLLRFGLTVIISDLEHHHSISRCWPSDFQLAWKATEPSVSAIEQTKVAVARRENALGDLLLRDVVEMAASRLESNIVQLWRPHLELEALRLQLAIYGYQLKFRELPTSLEQIESMGLLGRPPRDLATGRLLTISTDQQLIVGPPVQEVRNQIKAVGDMPALVWPFRRLGIAP